MEVVGRPLDLGGAAGWPPGKGAHTHIEHPMYTSQVPDGYNFFISSSHTQFHQTKQRNVV